MDTSPTTSLYLEPTPTPTSTESSVPSGTTGVNVTAAVSGTVASITFVGIIVFVIIIRRKRRRMSYEKQWRAEQNVTRTERGSGASVGDDSGRANSPDSYKCNMYDPPNTRTHNRKISKPYSNPRTDEEAAMKELSPIPIPPRSGFVPGSRPSHRQDRLDIVNQAGDVDGNVFGVSRNGNGHSPPTPTARNPQVIGHRPQPRDHGHNAGLWHAENSTDATHLQSVMDRALALTASVSAPGNPHIIPGNPQAIDHSPNPNEQECYTDIWNAEQYTDTLAPTSAADFVMKPTSAPGNPHVISRNPQALERSPQPNDQDASDLAASSATAFALAILTEPATAPGNPHAMADRLT
ncbi:hypothetical protein BG011_010247 [Mortierella polycephala]|uniref:Uncharacterized protein n=1 Tax=Mortierella polycephala TaxID=41804 RepID=A0A9P6QC34_9FUNG|nr:hypothetical protein BG011_010247 [Mortierella polycephala]